MFLRITLLVIPICSVLVLACGTKAPLKGPNPEKNETESFWGEVDGIYESESGQQWMVFNRKSRSWSTISKGILNPETDNEMTIDSCFIVTKRDVLGIETETGLFGPTESLYIKGENTETEWYSIEKKTNEESAKGNSITDCDKAIFKLKQGSFLRPTRYSLPILDFSENTLSIAPIKCEALLGCSGVIKDITPLAESFNLVEDTSTLPFDPNSLKL